ncbi:MAG: DUF58 domain-containing protein, partial [Planctomycetes bacterium]|nr:DUF58 domain-containing protein [Planctomycetota bacterium]
WVLPKVGLVELEDPETGELVLVDTTSKRARRRFAADAALRAASREQMFRRMDTQAIEIRTDRSYVDPLVRFFRKREKRL